MSTTRRTFAVGALKVTGGLVVAVCVPRAAFAGCTTNVMTMEFNQEGVINLPDWKVGDCELKQATLRISGNSLILNGLVCTHHTHTHDVWHMKVDLFTRETSNPSQIIPIGSGSTMGRRCRSWIIRCFIRGRGVSRLMRPRRRGIAWLRRSPPAAEIRDGSSQELGMPGWRCSRANMCERSGCWGGCRGSGCRFGGRKLEFAGRKGVGLLD